MPRFSVLIRWEDGDEEQGEFGWTGLADNEAGAEASARAAMRAAYIEQYGEEGEDEDELCEHRTDAEGKFGGSVIEIARGAVWQAQDMEDALRGLLKAADETAGRCGWSDHGERETARKLLTSLDAED